MLGRYIRLAFSTFILFTVQGEKYKSNVSRCHITFSSIFSVVVLPAEKQKVLYIAIIWHEIWLVIALDEIAELGRKVCLPNSVRRWCPLRTNKNKTCYFDILWKCRAGSDSTHVQEWILTQIWVSWSFLKQENSSSLKWLSNGTR
jgi:hypothetical protein